MTALERLLAEEWPDGSFGGPRPRARSYSPAEAQQAAREAIARRHADLRAELLTDLRTRKATRRAGLTPAPRTRKDQP
ncbi:hypothetical protein ACWGHA_11075 [Streptomyces xanthophaeus]